MSNLYVYSNANSASNTLDTALTPGGTVSITGYTQAGSSITFTSIVNPTIESSTTGYKSSGTDIGNSYCVYIAADIIGNTPATPASKTGTIDVSNYSSCSIIMCGSGGGGSTPGGTSIATPLIPGPGTPAPGGVGAAGGDGAAVIINRYPLTNINSISYTVARSGAGAASAGTPAPGVGTATPGQNGTAGSATNITFSDSNTITTNGGNGANRGNAGVYQTGTPGTDGTSGNAGNIVSNISYTPYPVATSTNFVNLIYNSQTNLIQVTNTTPATTCRQGGPLGLSPTSHGKPGYVRIYLYT